MYLPEGYNKKDTVKYPVIYLLDGPANEDYIHIVGVGKEGLTPTKLPRVMEVDANLLAEKLKKAKSKQVKVFFDYLPDENHATIMHEAVSNSFNLIYPVSTKD